MEKDAPCGFYIAKGEGSGVWRRKLGNGFKMRPRVSFMIMSLVNFLTVGWREGGARSEMWVFLTLSRSGPASAPRRAVSSRCARRGRTPLATQLSFNTRTFIIIFIRLMTLSF